MSIKERSKSASTKSTGAKYPDGYVVPETAIRKFVESTGIFDIEEAAVRLQAVADATRRLLDNPINQPNAADLRLILRIATESKNSGYQQIMKAIIAGLEQGPHGIEAAHLTARRSVELAFRWTRDYVSTFQQFRDRLRQSKLESDCLQPTTKGRQLRVVADAR